MLKQFNILVLFLVLSELINAQKDEKIINQIKSSAGPEFNVVNVPDSFKNESAVIIASYQSRSYDFISGYEKGLVILFHQRILLQDKAAVANFSELTFRNDYYRKVHGDGPKMILYNINYLKIVKPDGKEIEIDLMNNAVKKENPNDDDESKIAVPNLEPGDIIDYFTVRRLGMYPWHISDTYHFQNKYPTLSTKIRIQLHPYEFLKWSSLNGAPEFHLVEKNDDYIAYELNDQTRSKQKELLWDYPARSNPLVYYFSFLRSKSEDTSHVITRAPFKYMADDYKMEAKHLDIGYLYDYFKKNSGTIDKKDQKTMVNEFFYLIRNPLYQKIIEWRYDYLFDRDPSLLTFWYRFLLDNKIPFEVISVPLRNEGSIDIAGAFSYSNYFRVTPNNGPIVFIGPTIPYALPNNVGSLAEGNKGFIYDPQKKKDAARYTTMENIRPATTKEENATNVQMTLHLNENDVASLNVKRTVSSIGHNKLYHQKLVIMPYDYQKSYQKDKYEVSKSIAVSRELKKYQEEKIKIEQRKVQDDMERNGKIKAQFEQDNNVKITDYKNFQLISLGIWEEHPACEYSDELILENVIKKVNQDIIVELPKLIEKQTELTDQDKARKEDIYMDYARSFKYHFTFTIPEGYTAEGLEALNKKVESETGGFISTAKVEGNVLTIETYKYYNSNYVPADKFSTMFGFLQAAVDFSKQKILLRKN